MAMAVATTSDSIPVVDLRLLSQSDINSLALSSPHSFNLDTLSDVVPKIDRSVFNESAGSRKQTYSRLPLFHQSQSHNPHQSQSQPQNPQPQPQPHNPPLPRRRGRPRLHPLPTPPPPAAAAAEAPPDLGRQENLQIVSILKKLFESRGKCSYRVSDKREMKNEKNENDNINNSSNNDNKSIVLVRDADGEVRNGKGEAVDLAVLAGTEDLFGPEIQRRTDGLRTEEQILGYMTGLDGQWGSRRKKRKVVDATVFGDGLPKGWKVLLGLKRKEGIVYLNCRRYVSPSGKQFISCKEVASYILSLNGHQDVGQPISGHHDDHASRTEGWTLGNEGALIHQDDNSKEIASCSFVAPISYVSAQCEKPGRLFGVKKHSVGESDLSLECRKCSLSFGDKDAHMQHLATYHQRSIKRRKLGQSLTDGVIVKDGKYECQFCHKSFTERHRYNGHIGAHIRYEGLGIDASPQSNPARTSSGPSSLAVVLHVPSKMNILADKNGESYTTSLVNNPDHLDSPECTLEADVNGTKQNPNVDIVEITEAVYSNCTGVEHNSVAGAPEITQAVFSSSKKENEHNPMTSAPEITEAVFSSSKKKNEHNPMTRAPEITEAVYSSSKKEIEFNPMGDVPEITEVDSRKSKIEDDPKAGTPQIIEAASCSSQIEDCKMIYDESKEIVSAKGIDMKSDPCMVAIPACGIDMNSVSHTCSPIMIQEPSKSESIHDQVNDCAGVIEDNNFQDGKSIGYLYALASTLSGDAISCKTSSEASLSSPKRKIINGKISDHILVGYNSQNDKDAGNAMSVEIDGEIGFLSSKDKFADVQSNDCDVTSYRSKFVDATDAMSTDGNACLEVLSPSVINVEKTIYENPNVIGLSICTVIPDTGNCNGDQKVQEDNHFLSLSGNRQICSIETYDSNNFTSKVEDNVELNASSPGKSVTALTNKDTAVAGTMQNELNTRYVFANIASEPTSGIETDADCMFSGDLKKSLLEGINGVGNEFQDYFHRSNVSSEEAAGLIMSNGDRRQALQVNVADQSSSWLQPSHGIPILDLIPNQCQDELRGTVPSNEQANMSGFEALRLGSAEPADFVLFTGQPSASVARSAMELVPDDQLEWGMSLTKMVTTSVLTSVCVWCSNEFSLEGMESEQQSESLGYMCPDCKAKISGQLSLLNNGFS